MFTLWMVVNGYKAAYYFIKNKQIKRHTNVHAQNKNENNLVLKLTQLYTSFFVPCLRLWRVNAVAWVRLVANSALCTGDFETATLLSARCMGLILIGFCWCVRCNPNVVERNFLPPFFNIACFGLLRLAPTWWDVKTGGLLFLIGWLSDSPNMTSKSREGGEGGHIDEIRELLKNSQAALSYLPYHFAINS